MIWRSRCEGVPLREPGWGHPPDDGGDGLCAACRASAAKAQESAPTTWDRFALVRGDRLEHYNSTTQCRMCGDEPIVLARLTLDDAGPYWGWRYSMHPSNGEHRGRLSMIYPWRQAVEICFPYGPYAETARGRGWIVRARAEILRPAAHPESG
jgi:hypothetical protein